MSLANDVFNGLASGLRFNKNKNALAINVAGRNKLANKRSAASSRSAVETSVSGNQNGTGSIVPEELDFFGVANAGGAAAGTGSPKLAPQSHTDNMPTKTTKKKRARRESSEEKETSKGKRIKEHNDHDSGNNEKSAKGYQIEDDFESNQSVAAFRKRLRIRVKGSDVPPPMPTFTLEALVPADPNRSGATRKVAKRQHTAQVVLSNIEASKYAEPTAIQMQSIPAMIRKRDVLGIAPTGSGKTAAFLIPLIMRLAEDPEKADGDHDIINGKSNSSAKLRSVIIAPTRELAQQIFREFEKLSAGRHFRACLLKKATLGNVSASLMGKDKSHGFHLVVSTPLRMVSLIQQQGIDLSGVQTLILDEADKLFEMGFLEQLDEIVSACGDAAQRAMFSATMPQQIEELAQTVLRDQVEIIVGTQNAGAETIDQKLMFVGQEQGKMIALRQLIHNGEVTPPTLVFVQSKERCKELNSELMYEGIRADAIHADRTQAQRDTTVKDFRNGKIWVLICTDLMGRGIDFKGVNCVINYDFPTSAISYIHRIGRTGRAQRKGKAITFFTLDDMEHLRTIANVIRLNGCDVPEWMLKLRKNSTKEKRRLEKAPPKRRSIRTTTAYDRDRAAKKRNIVRQSKQNTKT